MMTAKRKVDLIAQCIYQECVECEMHGVSIREIVIMTLAYWRVLEGVTVDATASPSDDTTDPGSTS